MNDAAGIDVRRLLASEGDLLGQVFELGERHKKWLGKLAPVVFEEYATEGRVLVAVRDGRVLGYVMFGLPNRPVRRVRLGQLCVQPDVRELGIGRLLVDELSRLYADRDGISLRCRRDWDAHKVWPKLGFEVRSNAVGNSKAGHELTAWWRDHGVPDLFSSAAASDDRMLVAVDTNVFRDLYEDGRGDAAEQSRALSAPWLEDEIRLALTQRTLLELNAIPDKRLRERLLGIAHGGSFHIIGRPPAGVHDPSPGMENAIIAALPPDALARDESLKADAQLLSQADFGGADAFVSRDENAVEHLTVAAGPFSDIWVSTPTDLIVHLDEIRDAVSYSPVRLRDTGYTVSEVDARAEGDLRPLLNNAAGETRTQFTATVRRAAETVGMSGSRRVVRDPDGNVVAGAFFVETSGRVLVTLLRVTESALAKTLANQLLHLVRKEAINRGVARVVVRDTAASAAVRIALADNGFRLSGEEFVTDAMRASVPWAELGDLLPELDVPQERPAASVVAELERVHWPLKVTDSGIPCFLVSIGTEPAAALFGREEMLWASDPLLGLSRQHVYYRSPSPRPGPFDAPARILWYEKLPTARVIAVSRVDQVVVSSPKVLHRRFRRLGVLSMGVIERQARNGRAMAIRFGDTEFFTHPVPLSRLREMNSRLEPLPSPREVDEEDFFRIYEEGRPE